MKRFNIAIDGPSAAGKSTIADILAEKLSYVHLDTGAMYRAVAYVCKNNGVAYDEQEKAAKLIEQMNLEMKADGSVILDGKDISKEIRTNEMSMGASDVSKQPMVREALVAMQQKIAKDGGYILDGRDIGTVVLKDAPVKIYMVASAEARAQRRYLQNIEKGLDANLEEILEDIKKRDYQDSHREHSPLKKADDAVLVDSSDLTIDEVVELIMNIIKDKVGA